jgi:hypothetical protein
MTRTIVLIACLALSSAAFAQDPNGGIEIVPVRPTTVPATVPAKVDPAQEARALLSTVSDVNPLQIAALLEKIATVTAGKDGSMATLFAIQSELTRQTGAFKAAQAAAFSSKNQDVDALFAEVIDGKSAPDAGRLTRVAATYEALLTQFGQLVNSRFLASNAGGIATYKGESHATDAAVIGESARVRATAYEANVNRAASDLRSLLALDAAR